jgi:hypothetical protein
MPAPRQQQAPVYQSRLNVSGCASRAGHSACTQAGRAGNGLARRADAALARQHRADARRPVPRAGAASCELRRRAVRTPLEEIAANQDVRDAIAGRRSGDSCNVLATKRLILGRNHIRAQGAQSLTATQEIKNRSRRWASLVTTSALKARGRSQSSIRTRRLRGWASSSAIHQREGSRSLTTALEMNATLSSRNIGGNSIGAQGALA